MSEQQGTASAELAALKARLFEYEQLFWLAARDILCFNEGCGSELPAECVAWYAAHGWTAAVFCSDTFGYACADCESIFPGQAAEIRKFYEAFGWDGVIAWVSEKRRERPLKQLQTPNYWKALAAVQEKKG